MTKYGFEEGEDYVVLASQNREAGATSGFVPGGNRKDHIITLDMAKVRTTLPFLERLPAMVPDAGNVYSDQQI